MLATGRSGHTLKNWGKLNGPDALTKV
jgi:hypothetical protein